MRIIISSDGAAGIALAEPEDFERFCITASGALDLAAVGAALLEARLGRMERDHAFIELDALRRLAGRQPSAWGRRLEDMAAFAAAHGWTARDGAVRAHIEWTTGEEE